MFIFFYIIYIGFYKIRDENWINNKKQYFILMIIMNLYYLLNIIRIKNIILFHLYYINISKNFEIFENDS